MSEGRLPTTWFDTRDGALLIGEAAVDERRDEGGAFVVNLGELVTERVFPFDANDFTKTNWKGRPTEDYLEFGHWALNVVQPSWTEYIIKPLSQRFIRRFYILGLGPEPRLIDRNPDIGSTTEFQRQIGSPTNISSGYYDDWSFSRVVGLASFIKSRTGKRSRKQDFDREAFLRWPQRSPDYQVIRRKHGGISPVNEALGDIVKWDVDNCIEWGIRVLEANPDREITFGLIRILSSRRKGPSETPILRLFGSKDQFIAAINERLQLRISASQRGYRAPLRQFRGPSISELRVDKKDELDHYLKHKKRKS